MMRIGMGDLVRLNSGGPQLLVVDVDEHENLVMTARRADNGEVFEHLFPAACLTRLCRAPFPNGGGAHG